MAIVNAFIKLADPAYQNLPLRDRLKDIVEGLFRVFDSNGNGVIESFELNEIVSDVITGIAGIHLEPWVTVISHVISHNCDITCDIKLYHVI